MANNSISKSYLSVSSPGTYLHFPSISATEKARKLTRRINVFASGLKKKYPEKLGYFASLPLRDINGTLEELEYVCTKLHPAPDGVIMLSNAYGQYFGDASLNLIYEKLNKLNVTVFEHPTTPCSEYSASFFSPDTEYESKWAADMTPALWQKVNRPIATRQFAAPSLDFPFESARTFFDLFYSHVPSRFPSIRWIIPHAGGGITRTIDRVITFAALWPNLTLTDDIMKQTLSKSFWFDLAGPWPADSAVTALLRWVDYTKIMWGSDTPFTPWAFATASSKGYDQNILKIAQNQNQINEIAYGNAQKLFSKDHWRSR